MELPFDKISDDLEAPRTAGPDLEQAAFAEFFLRIPAQRLPMD